ncbi:RNA polymerase sigma factor [Streptomyces microflavus]|uniref:RNA polymerase sigma factor n=1 Tax=Streptomyces microflavus TaxID=1919 RepID=UPI003658140A
MPQTPSASETPSCDGDSGHPMEVAAIAAAQDPANKAALAALFDGFYEPVMRYMQGRVKDPATAEDLAQEVFVKIVQKIHSYSGGGIFAWVWAISRNVYNDFFRPMKNRGFEQPTGDMWQLDAPSADMGPEELAEWDEVRRAIRGKLDKLPDTQHMVLSLRITCGFSTAETAEIMGKPVGTIRVLQCRALAKLRKSMPQGSSNLATFLLSATDAQRAEDVMHAAPTVRLRETKDAGSRG